MASETKRYTSSVVVEVENGVMRWTCPCGHRNQQAPPTAIAVCACGRALQPEAADSRSPDAPSGETPYIPKEMPPAIQAAWTAYALATVRAMQVPFGHVRQFEDAMGDTASQLREAIADEIARLTSERAAAQQRWDEAPAWVGEWEEAKIAAVLAEREACAQIAASRRVPFAPATGFETGIDAACNAIAALIRERPTPGGDTNGR